MFVLREFPLPGSTLCTDKVMYRLFTLNDLRSHHIVALRHSQLLLYSLPTKKYTAKFSVPSSVDLQCTSAVLLSSKIVFACGYFNKSQLQAAIMVYADRRPASLAPDMLRLRQGHSLVRYMRSIYVFGGDYSQPSAEKFDVDSGQWSLLPRMISAHRNFNACLRRLDVYLCGGFTAACEVYSIARNEYWPLQLRLSAKFPSTAYRDGRDIVVLCRDTPSDLAKYMKYTLRGNRLFRREEHDQWIPKL